MLQKNLLTGYKVLETKVTTLQKYSEIVHETVNNKITIKLLFFNFINTFSLTSCCSYGHFACIAFLFCSFQNTIYVSVNINEHAAST